MKNTSFQYWQKDRLVFDGIVIVIFAMLFLLSDDGFSYLVAVISLIVFYLYFILFITERYRIYKKINIYFSVELVFSIFYYILFFFPYQKHILGLEDYRLNKFLPFSYENGANHGLYLAVIGYVAFHMGNICIIERQKGAKFFDLSHDRAKYKYFDDIFFVFFLALVGYYRLSGLQAADLGRYTNAQAGGAVSDGLYIVILMACVLGLSRAICRFANDDSLRLSNWATLAVVAFWSANILIAGDRNNFLIIALAAVGGLAAFVYRIGWLYIFMSAFVALALYNTVEVVRVMPEPTFEALMSALSEPRPTEPGGSSFGNTTATLRATFDIVPGQLDYAYGFYKLVGFIGFVPLVRGYLLSPNEYFVTSADALTAYMIGTNAGWGVGSNVLSDIYMDFGLPGVPLLMALLGYTIVKLRSYVRNHGPTSVAVYLYMMTLASVGEMPRYSYDFPVRLIVWGLIIFALYNLFFNIFLSRVLVHKKLRRRLR